MTDGSWDVSKREIRLWALDRTGPMPSAIPVTSVASAEAESLLEDILVGHPDLLERGLHIIGRQFETGSGPLDLVGIDEDGRLVIFELKRGTLAREAVTQTLDYAAAIQEMDRDELARHLASCSGRKGVAAIPDFNAWYDEVTEGSDGLAQRPRMVLVGLGIDQRALRMVKFLAEAGVEIDVLTFQVFERDGQQFIARHVEVTSAEAAPRSTGRRGQGREQREAHLQGLAAEVGVVELLDDMRTLIHEHLRTRARGAQNKSGVTFYRRDWPEDGLGTQRAFVSLVLDPKTLGQVAVYVTHRAVRDGGEAMAAFLRDVLASVPANGWRSSPPQHGFVVTPASWPQIRHRLIAALEAVADGVDLAEQAANEGS